jgi:hypothetical protein
MNLKKIFATLIFGIIGILSSKAQVNVEAYMYSAGVTPGAPPIQMFHPFDLPNSIQNCLLGQDRDYFHLDDGSLWYWFHGTWRAGFKSFTQIEGSWKDFGDCAGIKTDGSLWRWGRNQYFSRTLPDDTIPRQIGTDTDWERVFADESQIFAIKSDGTLWSFGYNGHYSLGIDRDILRQDTNYSYGFLSTPHKVGSDNDWDAVYMSSNKRFTLARKKNGNIWGWGRNNTYMGFDLSISYVEKPTLLLSDNWKDVSIASTHVLALKSDSTLWSWGQDVPFKGRIIENQRTPVQIDGGSYHQIGAAQEISAGLTGTTLRLFYPFSGGPMVWKNANTYTNDLSIVDFDIELGFILIMAESEENARILPKDIISHPVIFYPNPANDIVHVVVKSDFIGTSYEITSITGQKISKGKIEREDTAISIQNLVKGIYLIHLGDDIQQSFKIIKK